MDSKVPDEEKEKREVAETKKQQLKRKNLLTKRIEDQRKYGYCSDVEHENLLMIFSNSRADILPGIIQHFETCFDSNELTL